MIIFLYTKVLSQSKFNLFYLFLILFGLLIGWQDIDPYLKKVENSWTNTFKEGGILYIYEIMLSGIVVLIMKTPDPQGIANLTYSFETFLHTKLLLPIFIAFGEEFFKLLIFLALISLINLPIKFKIIISIILSSFIFGYMHVFNFKLTAGLPIAISSIPGFIFLIKYKSVIPLIISHFIFDTLAFISHIDIIGKDIAQLIYCIAILFWLITTCIYPMVCDFYLDIRYHLTRRKL